MNPDISDNKTAEERAACEHDKIVNLGLDYWGCDWCATEFIPKAAAHQAREEALREVWNIVLRVAGEEDHISVVTDEIEGLIEQLGGSDG